MPPTLSLRLDAALMEGGAALDALADAEPVDDRDALLAMLAVHDLHTAPIDQLGEKVRWQHHPAVAALKCRLEERFVERLKSYDDAEGWSLPDDAVAAMRVIAKKDLVPAVYDWVADEADPEALVEYLSLEGGPDGGFDDLVAACQIGLDGEAKLELARNYWDEMGNGTLDAVHTELHRDLTRALGLRAIPRSELPMEALERGALGSLLATNRWFQPEMVGALGLLELQAGPRCRKVVAALERVGAPAGAFPFYAEHATVDPRHGKDWLDNAIASLAGDAAWAEGIVRGARWRSVTNARFFAAMAERCAADRATAAA